MDTPPLPAAAPVPPPPPELKLRRGRKPAPRRLLVLSHDEDQIIYDPDDKLPDLAAPPEDASHHLPLPEIDHGTVGGPAELSLSPVRKPRSRTRRVRKGVAGPDAPGRRRGGNRQQLASGTRPANARRARRAVMEEGIGGDGSEMEEGVGKGRKRRRRSVSLLHAQDDDVMMPSGSSPALVRCGERARTEGVWEMVSDLVMWKDIAKSSLWFGLGSMCFLSSCFTRSSSFNMISAISHVGLFILPMAYFRNNFLQRCQDNQNQELRLKEEDVLRAIRLVLPAANAAIGVIQEVFSGKPSMTLKVAPAFLFASKYGHLITPWRLSALGFFSSFTIPKLYSCYSHQIHSHAESIQGKVLGAWKASQHKRIAALSTAIIFWNLFSVKTRIFAAFISLVLLHCRSQQQNREFEATDVQREGHQEQAIALPEN